MSEPSLSSQISMNVPENEANGVASVESLTSLFRQLVIWGSDGGDLHSEEQVVSQAQREQQRRRILRERFRTRQYRRRLFHIQTRLGGELCDWDMLNPAWPDGALISSFRLDEATIRMEQEADEFHDLLISMIDDGMLKRLLRQDDRITEEGIRAAMANENTKKELHRIICGLIDKAVEHVLYVEECELPVESDNGNRTSHYDTGLDESKVQKFLRKCTQTSEKAVDNTLRGLLEDMMELIILGEADINADMRLAIGNTIFEKTKKFF
ncbi:hypothetical protein LOZ65_003818 [Ophidiomyces ophidiicola]|nr:hypothetical protein LOZ65_003818 [Ophidiomyces ophidiicola]